MKKLPVLFAFLMVSVFTFAQTTVKTFDPEGAAIIKLDFKYKKADDQKWDKETVRIQLEIHTNMPEEVMKQLVKAGRYNLDGKRVGDEFVISAPNIEKSVTVGGVTLDDQIYVHVERPVWMQLSDGNLSVAARGMDKAIKSKVEVAEITFVYVGKTAANADNKEDKLKDKVVGKNGKKKNDSRALNGQPPAGGGAPNQEMKAQFGEILIDGVVWELE